MKPAAPSMPLDGTDPHLPSGEAEPGSQPDMGDEVNHSTFSIVLEGFTVTAGHLHSLEHCLRSLASRDLSPERAQEVLLMDTGNVDIDTLRAACRPFPWVRIVRLPNHTRYFEAKVAGAGQAAGDVIVFCDADNIYLPGWLRSMVTQFENPVIHALVGQTSVSPTNVYSTVFALSFFFPPFESAPGLVAADHCYGNNSALRRTLVEKFPIPTDLPLLRGNDYLHWVQLRKLGSTIWRQRDARALHESPDNLEELVRRYLARGNDRVVLLRMARPFLSEMAGGARPRNRLTEAARVVWENVADLAARTVGVIRSAPLSLRYYPLAFPISLVLLTVVVAGMAVSLFFPGRFVEDYLRRYHPQASFPPRIRHAGGPGMRT